MKMPKDLNTFIAVCEKVFPLLEEVKGCDLVLALGNTGCGKSTMFNGLLYGPESLEIKDITTEKEIFNKLTG